MLSDEEVENAATDWAICVSSTQYGEWLDDVKNAHYSQGVEDAMKDYRGDDPADLFGRAWNMGRRVKAGEAIPAGTPLAWMSPTGAITFKLSGWGTDVHVFADYRNEYRVFGCIISGDCQVVKAGVDDPDGRFLWFRTGSDRWQHVVTPDEAEVRGIADWDVWDAHTSELINPVPVEFMEKS